MEWLRSGTTVAIMSVPFGRFRRNRQFEGFYYNAINAPNTPHIGVLGQTVFKGIV